MFHIRAATIAAAVFFGQMSLALAQNAEEKSFSLELNKTEDQAGNCLATFKATNRMGVRLKETILQIFVLDQQGITLTDLALNFREFKPVQTKFLKFPLPHACASISKLHPNGFTKCSGDSDLTEACTEGLRTWSRTKIKFNDTDE